MDQYMVHFNAQNRFQCRFRKQCGYSTGIESVDHASPTGGYCRGMNAQHPRPVKTLGRRAVRRSGLPAAEKFLEMVIALRGDKPFIPRGVHRFSTFEESHRWSIRMMARRRNLDRHS